MKCIVIRVLVGNKQKFTRGLYFHFFLVNDPKLLGRARECMYAEWDLGSISGACERSTAWKQFLVYIQITKYHWFHFADYERSEHDCPLQVFCSRICTHKQANRKTTSCSMVNNKCTRFLQEHSLGWNLASSQYHNSSDVMIYIRKH